MRSLGDIYVKSGEPAFPSEPVSPSFLPLLTDTLEFRRHKEVTNPLHIIGFLSQWKMYLDELPRGPDAPPFLGKKLDRTVFEKVRVFPFESPSPKTAVSLPRPLTSDVRGASRAVVRAHARYEGCMEAGHGRRKRSLIIPQYRCPHPVVFS